MKSNKIFVFIILMLFFSFGLILTNCDSPNNDNNNDNDDNRGGVYLTGTYGRPIVSQMTYNDRLVFTETTFSLNSAGSSFNGAYKYDGAVLTLTISGVKHNKYANLSNSTLVISGDGAYSEFFNDTWTPR